MITSLQNYQEYPTKIHSIDEYIFDNEISVIEAEILGKMDLSESNIPEDFGKCLSLFVFFEYCQSVQSKATVNVGETESTPELTYYSPKLQVSAWNLGASIVRDKFDKLIRNCYFKSNRELWR